MELARQTGGKVTAIYVADTRRYLAPGVGGLSPKTVEEVMGGMREAMMKEGETATRHVEEEGKAAGVSVEKQVLEGHPAEEIVKAAEKGRMDVIVMGSIGRTGLEKFVLGSVAEKVARISKVHVLIVH